MLFGGYHVLTAGSTGIILSTDSKVYTTISDSAHMRKGGADGHEIPTVSVASPQFTDEPWEYQIELKTRAQGSVEEARTYDSGDHILLTQTKGEGNSLIQLTLYVALMAAYILKSEKISLWARSEKHLNITILADNDFYSQRKLSPDAKLESVLRLPRFSFLKSMLKDTVKTGLGSSSALVSSLSSAIICHLAGIDIRTEKHKEYCNAAAQLIHYVLQSLSGSGADISAAFFGSHIFKSPDKGDLHSILSNKAQTRSNVSPVLNECPSFPAAKSPPPTPVDHGSCSSEHVRKYLPDVRTISECLGLVAKIYGSAGGRKHISMPPGFLLLSLDVSAGTKSPGCSKKFLQWLESNQDSYKLLAKNYSVHSARWVHIVESLIAAYLSNQTKYISVLESLAFKPSFSWSSLQSECSCPQIAALLSELVSCSSALRNTSKQLGALADLPIEPPVLSPLIDYLSSLNGVIWAGTTGAGGYDALSLIVLAERVASSRDEEIAYRMRSIASIHKLALEWINNAHKLQGFNDPDNLIRCPLPLLDGTASYFSSPPSTSICMEPKPPFCLAYNL